MTRSRPLARTQRISLWILLPFSFSAIVPGPACAQGVVNSSSAAPQTVQIRLNAPAFQPDSKAPYAHPYYWAPFFLMGNWL